MRIITLLQFALSTITGQTAARPVPVADAAALRVAQAVLVPVMPDTSSWQTMIIVQQVGFIL